MLVRGTQTAQPLEIEYGVDTVYERKNIRRVEEPGTESRTGFFGYEYEETQYSYIEWTCLQDKRQQEEGINLKLAVAELAEIVVGGK